MKVNKKVLYALLLALCMSLSMMSVVSASPAVDSAPAEVDSIEGDEFPGIMPFWLYTINVDLSLNFIGSTAYLDIDVMGMTNATSVTGKVTLERQTSSGWSLVKTWSNLSSSNRHLIFSETYGVTKGYTYRMTFDGKVYAGSSYESICLDKTGTCN